MDKRNQLLQYIAELTKEDSMVAFSGGVDSSILLKLVCDAAKKNQTTVYAVTVQTKLHPKGDLAIAKRVAAEMGARHKVLQIDELSETGIINNPKDRCYRCKKGIFQKMKTLAEKNGIHTIMEGTNADDLLQYRPGLRALAELEILSPLKECGITKSEVRQLAGEMGVSVANRPSMPCLATRIPYGKPLSYELLDRIDEAEQYIRSLDFYNVRVRVYDCLARIEIDNCDMDRFMIYRQEIIEKLKEKGFLYVTLDLEGFRSGSMDVEN